MRRCYINQVLKIHLKLYAHLRDFPSWAETSSSWIFLVILSVFLTTSSWLGIFTAPCNPTAPPGASPECAECIECTEWTEGTESEVDAWWLLSDLPLREKQPHKPIAKCCNISSLFSFYKYFWKEFWCWSFFMLIYTLSLCIPKRTIINFKSQ